MDLFEKDIQIGSVNISYGTFSRTMTKETFFAGTKMAGYRATLRMEFSWERGETAFEQQIQMCPPTKKNMVSSQ